MYYIFLKEKIEKVDVDEENLHHHKWIIDK
jgi:hypothetical protein